MIETAGMGQKTVVILVGPKGSGKTHLGRQLEEDGIARFLRIEPIFIQVYERGGTNQEGYDAVFDAIAETMDAVDHAAFETLAAAPEFAALLERLREQWLVKLVRLRTPLAVCADRVRDRSPVDHLPVSDERVHEYNAIADAIELPWDLELDSSGATDMRDLLVSIRELLRDESTRGAP